MKGIRLDQTIAWILSIIMSMGIMGGVVLGFKSVKSEEVDHESLEEGDESAKHSDHHDSKEKADPHHDAAHDKSLPHEKEGHGKDDSHKKGEVHHEAPKKSEKKSDTQKPHADEHH